MAGKGLDSSVGEILLAAGALSRSELQHALDRQRSGDQRPIGEVLVAMGFVGNEDVEFALLRQRARRGEIERGDPTGLFEIVAERTRQRASDADELARVARQVTKKTNE